MVIFLSLFVGLVAGTQRVEVAVSPGVATVQILLDGRLVGTLEGEPWAMQLDFGQELQPRELVAVALDGEGGQVAADRLWIDLPSRRADARLVPRRGPGGRMEAVEIVWECPEYGAPQQTEVWLDGELVSEAESTSISVAGLDSTAHVLKARLSFSDTVVVERELVLGAGRIVSLGTELTSVAVVLGDRLDLPQVDQMKEWFVRDRAPLEVNAWEIGPARVVVVSDIGAGKALRDHYARDRNRIANEKRRQRLRRRGELEEVGVCTLDPGTSVRLMTPVPVAVRDRARPTDVFPCGDGFPGDRVGLYSALTRSDALEDAGGRRLADAVAVAAMAAVEDNRRRAVVLLLGSETEDHSVHSIVAAREYLRDLHVPLLVWDLSEAGSGARDGWGSTFRISSFADFEAGVRLLSYLLQDQRIVWVKGTHPPQAISLGPEASEVRLAGREQP